MGAMDVNIVVIFSGIVVRSFGTCVVSAGAVDAVVWPVPSSVSSHGEAFSPNFVSCGPSGTPHAKQTL
jgi:hypothetical protein